MSTFRATQRLFSSTTLFLLLVAPAGISAAAPSIQGDSCATAVPLHPNETHQTKDSGSAQPNYFKVDLPGPGLLTLNARSTIYNGNDVTLTVLEANGQHLMGDTTSFDVIRETPHAALIHAQEAGTLCLAVAPEGNAGSTTDYRVQVMFAEEAAMPDQVLTLESNPPASCSVLAAPAFGDGPFTDSRYIMIHRDAGLTRDVEPEDCDIIDGVVTTPGVIVLASVGTPREASLFEGRGCEPDNRIGESNLGTHGSALAAPVFPGDHRLVLDPIGTDDSSYALHVRFYDICTHATRGERSDLPWCASTIAPTDMVRSTLGSGEKYLTFTLDRQQAVTVDVTGSVMMEIMDEKGQRLGNARTSNAEGTETLTRTLAGGRYFLRISAIEEGIADYSVLLHGLNAP